MVDGHDERHLVDIGCQNMALFAEVGGAADDIIAPRLHLRNPGCLIAFCCQSDLNKVSNCYRVGRTNATNAEIAFDMAFHTRTIVQTDDVTATR